MHVVKSTTAGFVAALSLNAVSGTVWTISDVPKAGFRTFDATSTVPGKQSAFGINVLSPFENILTMPALQQQDHAGAMHFDIRPVFLAAAGGSLLSLAISVIAAGMTFVPSAANQASDISILATLVATLLGFAATLIAQSR